MDIEKLKNRCGYSGKSQQWQYGFDLAIREMQAANAQAVPEGFVLVKDKPVAYMVQNKFWNGEFEVKLLSEMPEPEFDGDSYDIEIPLYAIEAQEQAND